MSATRPSALCPHLFVLDADEAANFYARRSGRSSSSAMRCQTAESSSSSSRSAMRRLLLSEESPEPQCPGAVDRRRKPGHAAARGRGRRSGRRAGRLLPARLSKCRCRRCSGASATASSSTRSVTVGRSHGAGGIQPGRGGRADATRRRTSLDPERGRHPHRLAAMRPNASTQRDDDTPYSTPVRTTITSAVGRRRCTAHDRRRRRSRAGRKRCSTPHHIKP